MHITAFRMMHWDVRKAASVRPMEDNRMKTSHRSRTRILDICAFILILRMLRVDKFSIKKKTEYTSVI